MIEETLMQEGLLALHKAYGDAENQKCGDARRRWGDEDPFGYGGDSDEEWILGPWCRQMDAVCSCLAQG